MGETPTLDDSDTRDDPGDPGTLDGSSTLDDVERSLAAAMRLLTDRTTTGDIARRCGYDLPSASWALLEYLEAQGSLRVSDIAACHGVDVSSITPRLKRLEGSGLVTRGRAVDDARAYLIDITDEGRRALESVHAARREILRHALAGVDSARLADTAAVLGRITAHLSTEPLASRDG